MKQVDIRINDCYAPYLQNQSAIILLFGSAGSGKSVFACQKLILRMLTERGHKFLAVRKFYATLRTSCYAELKAVIDRAGIGSYFTMGLSPLSITCKATKSTVIFRGIDDPEKIKSISGITGIWVEEANELSEDEFDQLQLRLRGETTNYKQTIVTFNPVVETHWLKTRYFDNPLQGVSILKTTYLDNAFIGSEYAEKLNQLKQTNPAYYRIYALGEWGLIQTGTEFWYSFTRNNVKPTSYNPNLPLWLSFDFNVNPYLTCIVAQVENGVLNILQEVLAKHPNNNTEALCQMVLRDYSFHNGLTYITGDPAGKNRDTRSKKTDYQIIETTLAPIKVNNRVPNSAPSVHLSGMFANGLFANMKVVVNPNCTKLINDLEVVKQDADGGMAKLKVKQKETGLTIEPNGHLSDALRYLIITIFAQEFNSAYSIKGGKVRF